jgi:hypothetical protein
MKDKVKADRGIACRGLSLSRWMLKRVDAAPVILALALSGCRWIPESQFTLRMESRLPKFIDPTGTRSPRDHIARVEFYSSPDAVRVRVTDPQRKTVFDERGTFHWHPRDSYQGHGEIKYPSHIVVSFPSGEDIFEQRAAEPVLYLSDDVALWNSRNASKQSPEPTAGSPDLSAARL